MNGFLKVLALCLAVLTTATGRELVAAETQLRIGTTQEFENMNPLIKQMAATTLISYTAVRTLLSLDENWQPACWLCTQIPTLENGLAKVITEDGKKKIVVDWEIKENAKWGDGTPVTGHDVAFSWEVGKSPNVSVGEKEMYERIEALTVDPKNPKKFTTKYGLARYDFAQLYTFEIVPKHIEGPVWEKTKNQAGAYEKQTVYNTNPTNPGLYNGPYKVKEIKLGSHVVLDRNPHFYGQRPEIDTLIFKLIPDTATLEANLLSGTIDVVSELGFTFDQALALEKRLKKDPALAAKYKVLFREGMTYEHIDFNLRNPILQDINVRRALVHAINRDKMTQALFEGRQKPALHNNHPLDPYYSEDVVKYPYDPKKAGELLDAAGWKIGKDKYRYKDGKKLSFTLMTTAQNKTRELVQVYLQNEWKIVGVEAKIKNEPARVYFGETVRKGKYEHMAMFAWVSSPDNPPRSTCHSENIPTEKNGYSGQNSGAWSNPRVDKLLDDIRTELAFEKRKAMMQKIQWEYTNDLPTIPLYLRAEIAAIPTNLSGFALAGHQFYSTLKAEYWKLTPKVAAK